MIALCVLCLVTVLSLVSGNGAIVLDDIHDIVRNRALGGGIYMALTETDNAFRSVSYLTYWLNRMLPGDLPLILHLTNLILHLLVGIFIYLTLREIESDGAKTAGIIAAGFFLLNPFIGSTVLYVSARPSILVTLFSLVAVWGTLRFNKSGKWPYLLAAFAGCLAAMFSKETGIVAPILVLLMWIILEDKRRWAIVALPLSAVAVIYVLLRLSYRIDLGDRGAEAPGSIGYLLTQLTVIPRYLAGFLWPVNLSLERDVLIRTGFFDPGVIISGAFLFPAFALILWLGRKEKRVLFFALWIPCALAPESSIIPLADMAFNHRFYFPGVGTAALLGIASAGLWESSAEKKRLVSVLGLLVLICFFVLTFNHSRAWATSAGAWREAVRVTPDNYRPRYNLGHRLLEDGRPLMGLPHLNAAIRIGGNIPEKDAMAYNARGLALFKLGLIDSAIEDFKRSMSIEPRSGDPVLHLGVSYIAKGRFDEAIPLLEHAMKLLPGDPKVGKALIKAREAAAALRRSQGLSNFPR